MAGDPPRRFSSAVMATISDAERVLFARTLRDFLLFVVRWLERNILNL
jgi:hypothetical protein